MRRAADLLGFHSGFLLGFVGGLGIQFVSGSFVGEFSWKMPEDVELK